MYSTAESAGALGISAKRLDNLLTGPARSLVPKNGNGRSRELSVELVELLAISLLLRRDLGIPIIRALELARALIAEPDHQIQIGALGSLHFDVTALRSVLQNALSDVIEDSLRPRRGRPPRSTMKKRGASW
jgi:hypothetical protein